VFIWALLLTETGLLTRNAMMLMFHDDD